jgi:hypothetical protein
MWIAQLIVSSLAVYAIIGLLFALPFSARGAERLDPSAKGAGLGFRLLIVPGAAALWPLLLWRWLRGSQTPPVENNAHRQAAAHREGQR